VNVNGWANQVRTSGAASAVVSPPTETPPIVTPSAIGTGGGGGASVVLPASDVVDSCAYANGTPKAAKSAATQSALRNMCVILITEEARVIRDDAVHSCGKDALKPRVVLDRPGEDRDAPLVAALDDRR